MKTGVWLLLLGLMPGLVWSAQRYEAEGRAIIEQGDVAKARQTAIDRALQQALEQREAILNSEQRLSDGELSSSLIRIQSRAKARNLKLLREQLTDTDIQVWISTELEPVAASSCQAASNSYRKTLAVLNFPLNSPDGPEYAPIDNAARILPGKLGELMSQAQVLPATHIRLYGDSQNAPGLVTGQGRLTSAIQTAKQLDTQFVLAGTLRTLAMRHPQQASAGNWFNRGRDALGLGEAERYRRDFELQVFVYEGFSGQLVFERRYQTDGDWPFARHQQPALGNQAFWHSDYGQAVARQLTQVAADVQEFLACQAFMVRIHKVENRELYIRQGSLAGIRVGDRFEVRQIQALSGREPGSEQLLSASRATATVIQVQPEFSQLQLSQGSGQLNLQMDDLLVSW